ncbi:hypothetical protein AAVH_43522 [Aphelenchoides avenae]|nr:hypothetical protein AAVH_43522 [Aphelenchus avenae]
MRWRLLLLLFVVYSLTEAGRYWGNHCGREARNRRRPAIDAFDRACYQHDRCQENRRVPDWMCSMQVMGGMMNAMQQTGRPIPFQILQGFGAEHGIGRRKRSLIYPPYFHK